MSMRPVTVFAGAAPIAVVAALMTSSGAHAQSSGIRRDTVRFGPFGSVVLYHPSDRPTRVALFVSGDGGWNRGVAEMASALAGERTLVAGIDIRAYLQSLQRAPGACRYPAGDLENLSQFIQRRTGLPQYIPPVLVGYSSGATLVYAALAQAPPTTFAGALSLGFCPDLPPGKPLCRGSGATGRDLSWVVLQGEVDQVCRPDSTRAFVARVPGARVVSLPQVGHGFGVARRWLPQFLDAFRSLAESGTPPPPPAAEIADLPLIEVRAAAGDDDRLAIVVSGDGGWASLDREVGNALAAHGLPVVGWNSLRYFWTPRTPDGAAVDLSRAARHYLAAWRKNRLVLVGYSRGADVLPFMAARLPEDLKHRVTAVVLIGPGRTTNFTFHAADLLFNAPHRGDAPVGPEIGRLTGLNVLCVFGSDDGASVCRDLDPSVARSIELSGGHHFGGRYEELAALILKETVRE